MLMQRLQAFMRDAIPTLGAFLPTEQSTRTSSGPNLNNNTNRDVHHASVLAPILY